MYKLTRIVTSFSSLLTGTATTCRSFPKSSCRGRRDVISHLCNKLLRVQVQWEQVAAADSDDCRPLALVFPTQGRAAAGVLPIGNAVQMSVQVDVFLQKKVFRRQGCTSHASAPQHKVNT